MADTTNKLPEGTDTVIEAGGTGGSGGGAGRSGTGMQGGSPSTAGNSTGARTSTTASDSQTDALITGGSTGTGSGTRSTGSTGDDTSGSNPGGIRGMVGNVTTKARDEATGRARGLVGDGLKSGSATLGNISTLIGDTVEQIEEKLGPQYAGYARTASETIQRYASTLENKDPDELVDDARELIRKSPGVAISAAAVLGFGLVRLLKAGMPDDAAAERRAGARRSDSTV
ncbi:hypothetical protein [Sphingomonas sp. LHG3406-1]|uniref:hypothetical protein n=1 Tax=Sphingomonas sp. LHG3406-1 TaxID=2804617 RepID=UPI00262424F4|nr:hypothetical protein [Sphingomonas sp. LHG3406-1]